MIRTFNQAIRDALDLSLSEDARVTLFGLGITDPKRFFGTTEGLLEKFGPDRLIECPTSENAYLGHAYGLALGGFKPVVHFQRMDFMLYAFDQLVNNAAKWSSMFSGDGVPFVIRALVGMGWGQGSQHSQNLAPLLAQIPGLTVVAPSCPESAFGLLRASLEEKSPVVFTEHRWLQFLEQDVETVPRKWKIGSAHVRKAGGELTIVTWSYGVAEALRFTRAHPEVDWEIVDLLTLSPLDMETVLASFAKTKRLLVWEPGWSFGGLGAEILAQVSESSMQGKTMRFGYPQSYPSASPAEAKDFYTTPKRVYRILRERFDLVLEPSKALEARWPVDQDPSDWSPWRS
jgi:acetoin:2,6-dichlorophenolindophenol oxidoreductase subunit beta